MEAYRLRYRLCFCAHFITLMVRSFIQASATWVGTKLANYPSIVRRRVMCCRVICYFPAVRYPKPAPTCLALSQDTRISCCQPVFEDQVRLRVCVLTCCRFYYECLMRPNAKSVLTALRKIKDLGYTTIANGHGPILR